MKKTIIWLTIFSVAMGFLETAVVIYIREMYYPDGFKFPLVPIKYSILQAELWRELATIIMLIAIGILVGKNKAQRFVFFLYSFAVWDLCYYIFLKLFINWPVSVFTWDILFLLPVPWVGPVLAPCIASCTMIALTFLVIWLEYKGYKVVFRLKHYLLLSLGSLVFIGTFVYDYILLLFWGTQQLSPQNLLVIFGHYEPINYNWWLFILGEAIILYGCLLLHNDSVKGGKHES